ncbi:MAG: SDR family NAD(P)-dependent oxidoreductase [Polyangiaceae bacterium]
MSKTIVIAGHGPGISDAVARRFGREGFSVALIARNAARLATAAETLTKSGLTAKAFPCDLADGDALRSTLREVKASLGPVSIVHYNAYTAGAGDLTTSKTSELNAALDVGVHGLITSVQETLPDLKAAKGAVLVTGGGLAFYDPSVDAMAVQWGAMGLAVTKAAQHKVTGLLHEKLKADGVYVGEVVVLGMVKGTAFDAGNATLDPNDIANKFWEIFQSRTTATVNFGGH